jgi:hypothetical protein
MHFTLRRLIVTFGVVMMLVLAFASASFAGEDGCSNDNSCGGSDTGSASGGAQTGFGGAVVAKSGTGDITTPLTLASGAVVMLTIAGGAAFRARRVEK